MAVGTNLVGSEFLLCSLCILLASARSRASLVGLFLLGSLLLAKLLALLELSLGDHFAGDVVKVQLGNSGSGIGRASIAGSRLVVGHGCGVRKTTIRLQVLDSLYWSIRAVGYYLLRRALQRPFLGFLFLYRAGQISRLDSEVGWAKNTRDPTKAIGGVGALSLRADTKKASAEKPNWPRWI